MQISDIAYVPVYTRNALIVATIQFIFEVSKAFPDHLHACFLPHFRFCPLQAALYSLSDTCIYIADKQLGICTGRLVYFSEYLVIYAGYKTYLFKFRSHQIYCGHEYIYLTRQMFMQYIKQVSLVIYMLIEYTCIAISTQAND